MVLGPPMVDVVSKLLGSEEERAGADPGMMITEDDASDSSELSPLVSATVMLLKDLKQC